MNLEWTNKSPTIPGFYVFKADGEWPKTLKRVVIGDWRLRRNPQVLYANESPISKLNGLWYGPIPETKE